MTDISRALYMMFILLWLLWLVQPVLRKAGEFRTFLQHMYSKCTAVAGAWIVSLPVGCISHSTLNYVPLGCISHSSFVWPSLRGISNAGVVLSPQGAFTGR